MTKEIKKNFILCILQEDKVTFYTFFVRWLANPDNILYFKSIALKLIQISYSGQPSIRVEKHFLVFISSKLCVKLTLIYKDK